MIYGIASSIVPDVKEQWLKDFQDRLLLHVQCVRQAGKYLGVSPYLLEIHDMSKWSPEEYPHYARQFCGDAGDPTGFARAWLHHQNHNPHHWEYWMPRTGHQRGGVDAVDGCLQMPDNYLREMVADWMGASMAYTSSWNMQDWLQKNLPKIQLHPLAQKRLLSILCDELGYDKTGWGLE